MNRELDLSNYFYNLNEKNIFTFFLTTRIFDPYYKYNNGEHMTTTQKIFNPIDYCFEFTADGWYKWDRKQASKEALKARNTLAKQLTAEGWVVSKFSLSGQLVTRGGIGSGHPQIEAVVTGYGLNASKNQ